MFYTKQENMMGKESLLGRIDRKLRIAGRVVVGIGALTLAVVASGCGGGEDRDASPAPVETTQQPMDTSTETEGATLTFDDLGGGSSIIQVYPGVEDIPARKKFNGTYNDGDTVDAECKTKGRTVHSDTSVGEENRSSNDWIRIHGTPGETQYATAAYVEDPEQLLAQLPVC
jgi:hypothetical protein